jgi:pimeloyl-ACP methyl ester carboxylesterase
MHYVTLKDGTPIWTAEKGSGPTLVLLQGLQFDSAFFWQRNIDALATSNRVVMIDPRGQGLSGKPIGGYTIDQCAADLYEVFDVLGLKDICLCGVAFGGLIALRYLELFGSGKIRSLVLCEMTPRLVSADGWDHPTFGGFPPEVAAAYGGQVRADRSVLAGFLQAAFAEPNDDATTARMLAQTFLTPTSVVADYIDDMVRMDFRALIPKIELPLLAIYGRKNNGVMPGNVGQWIAEAAPHGELVELHGAGHSPFWDDAPAFNTALAAFAAKH